MLRQDQVSRFTAMLLPAVAAVGLFHSPDSAAYEMVAYQEGAGSDALFDGRYDDAMAAASSSRARSSETALQASTNMCVALTLTRELDAAERACMQALGAARRVDAAGGRVRRGVETGKALNNLGVLRALKGDRASAAADFRRAARTGGWPGASRNLVYLQTVDAQPRMAQTSE